MPTPGSRRARAWAGLGGAVLAVLGDLLILGRAASGPDFDRAAGVVAVPGVVDDRWRSLWNGAALSEARIRAGTVTGVLGIGLLSAFGLGNAARSAEPGVGRNVAMGSVAVVALAGALTHHACGAVVLALRRAAAAPPGAAQPVSPLLTGLLAVSAGATLGALTVLSVDLALGARRRGSGWWRVLVTPFPWVAATLATFGRLPAPVGGYLRPASISTGLALYLALDAVAGGDAPSPAV